MRFEREVQMSHVGPMPAPWTLAEYDKLDPGRAKKIFDLAEDQARHRMKQENRVIGSSITRSWAGLGVFLFCSTCAIALGAYMTSLGHPQPAAWLVGAVLSGDAAALVYVGRQNREERESKSKALTKQKGSPGAAS